MAVVRISKGVVDPARLADAEARIAASEAALRSPIQELPGLLHYYVGIDRYRHSRQPDEAVFAYMGTFIGRVLPD